PRGAVPCLRGPTPSLKDSDDLLCSGAHGQRAPALPAAARDGAQRPAGPAPAQDRGAGRPGGRPGPHPEAISFSIIAGVPPQVGLFASFTMAVTIAVVGGRPAMIS